MNLFEDWDATEKRTQQQSQGGATKASSAATTTTRASPAQQQQQAPGAQQQQQQQRQQRSPVSRDVSAGNNSSSTIKPSQQRRPQGGILGSAWGQRQRSPSPTPQPAASAITAAASSSATGGARSSAAGGGSSSSTNPFAASTNPFASSDPFTPSKPFGAGAGTNPFASNAMGAAGGAGTGRSLLPAKRGELPIFSLQRLDFDGASTTSSAGGRGKNLRAASASWSILAVAVGNGTLAMATSDCCVIRWNAEREGEAEEIEISKRQEDTIHKIFLDPTGNHLLACLHGGETYYLHSSTLRPKRLLKWSGVVVEAVAFDAQRCTEV
ncbi:unnamed protein product [Laminaria digitata]